MDAVDLRARLLADPGLGTGNVLVKLGEHGADLDGPGVTFDTVVDGSAAWTSLTLGELTCSVAARAGWFAQRGVVARDPVAVFVTSAAACLLNFLALARLGAIPALMNGNMAGEVAAEFIRRLRVVGVLVDDAHRAVLGGHDLGAPILGDAGATGTGDPRGAPAHFRHHPDDPVVITHSSGTTRMPAAVVHTHASLFAAVRRLRLAGPRSRGPVRELSVLPAAHAAGIITLNQALCNRYEVAFLSAQGAAGTAHSGAGTAHSGAGTAQGAAGAGVGDLFAGSGAAVLDAIEGWRPTGVFGFAVTWAELARYDLSTRDLGSVRNWFNTGDCAHEAHIRRLVAVGSHPVRDPDGGVRVVAGSRFVDGIGSTEMGHSAFHITHELGSDRYGRCVGRPYRFTQVALLDLDTGREVPVGRVGHVGLKSPTLAAGYWNDSVSTYRTRLGGWYLTGDLMYRDEEGWFYHVDRAVDAVDLGGGQWLYTALCEERILMRCPDVRDCTVVAATPAGDGDGAVATDVLLILEAGADPHADRGAAVREALGAPAAATLRRLVAVPDGDIVVGPTGKVRKFLMRQRHLTGTQS